jgi:hypothetical protein
VKSFSVFCVEVIHGPIKLNRLVVMASIVNFWDVKMLANTK